MGVGARRGRAWRPLRRRWPGARVVVPVTADLISSALLLSERSSEIHLQTDELFVGNAFYGHGQVLRGWSGWERPLPAIVPHGIGFTPDAFWRGETRARLSSILCFPPYLRSAYEKVTRKLVVPSAAPFCYVLEQIEDRTDRHGTIFFPTHSTHRLTATENWADLAGCLVDLIEPVSPVTVCVYWRDIQLGHHMPFVDAGLDVVCAGHIYDEHFLFRLAALLRRHEYAATTGLGSHVVYAAAAGCRVTALPGVGQPARRNIGGRSTAETNVDRTGERLPPTVVERLRDCLLAKDPDGADVAEQGVVARRILGSELMMAPSQLRASFERLRRVDRVGAISMDIDGGRRIVPPMAWKRDAAELRGRLRRMVQAARG